MPFGFNQKRIISLKTNLHKLTTQQWNFKAREVLILLHYKITKELYDARDILCDKIIN